MASTPQSPLTEASTTSLDDYFSRRPPYDAETLAKIKAEFRRMREVWLKANVEGAKTPKAKKAKEPATTSIGVDIFSLDPEAGPGAGAAS